ncbi:Hypothetical predicted protein [Paramuricea clavata]|uniref:Uncharacterized protein n=1 Tax=Paramuricea clavata TaxID=317549 RepID=A0A7D9I9N0_PARCT|nr:Hypothetical predicted protein [Paramuricea clavata]
MVERRFSRLSTILVVFLSLFLLVESFKPCRRLVKGASCLMCALKLDIKQFPTRNTPGLPRHSPSTTKASLPPSCKLKVSLHLLKLSMVASSLVLLSGDVSLNPGPYADDLPKARGFKVAHLNVRSLVNKLDDISHLVRSKSFDIFSVSETWLNPTILDTEIDIPGYTLAGFTDATITWFKSYLYQRIQVTRVDNATSSAKYVSVGVPQGSVLGPLLFILYVNDLPSCIKKCKVTMYADDTVLYFSSSTLSGLEENLNADLEILRRYLNDNLLTLNAEKSKFVIFGSTRKLNSFREFSLEINAHNLERRDTFKYLGIKLNQNMSWSDQIDALSKKVSQRLGVLRRVKYLLPPHGRLAIYNSLILPLFDYADIVWGDKNNKVLMHNLQVLQNNAARTILDYPKYFSGTEALAQLNWMPLSERRRQHRCIGIYKCINKYIKYQFNLVQNVEIHSHNTRRRQDLHLPRSRTNWGKQRYIYQAVVDWNNLNLDQRQSNNLTSFKNSI